MVSFRFHARLFQRKGHRRLFNGLSFLCLSFVLAQNLQVFQVAQSNVAINSIDSDPNICLGPNESLAKKYQTVGKKWIVVTTINQPTDAMQLLCNLPDWNVRSGTLMFAA